jgi:tRNA pseudouridine synthase 10
MHLCSFCYEIYKDKTEAVEDPACCELCEGLSNDLEFLSKLMVEESKDFEFESFYLGTKLYDEIAEREEKLNVKGLFKHFFNLELRSRFEELSKKEHISNKGDIYFLVDARLNYVKVTPSPLYLCGRYNKLSRGLSQTTKTCLKCNGHGCIYCNGKGKLYDNSVEEIISGPLIKETLAKGSKFHGMGREDVDVRMLGNGRPFVIELIEPKKRKIDLKKAEKEINKSDSVKVKDLEYSCEKRVKEIKSAKLDKTYRATVSIQEHIQKEQIESALEELSGSNVYQRTPQRVLHRRSDIVRIRRVKSAELLDFNPGSVKIAFKTESGTYIKELVNGDKGRTVPNLASLLNCECRVDHLDVISIEEGKNGQNVTWKEERDAKVTYEK